MACERNFIKTRSLESRFVIAIGQENIPFAGTSVHLQPRNFTGWGSEGVKRVEADLHLKKKVQTGNDSLGFPP